MGHDNVPSISPAKWRTSNPQSPFRKSGVHTRDESLDKPDLGWKALLKRHKFLLFMLAILTFLCTVYLYFAITFATVDTCSTLNGKLKAQCYQLQGRNVKGHGNHGRRALLLHNFDFSTDDLTQEVPLDECGQQYENYSPCRNVSVFRGTCRQRSERPPLCRVPVPLGYQRPGAWQRSMENTSREWERTGTPGFPFEELQDKDSSEQRLFKVRGFPESPLFSGDHMYKVLTIGCQGCKILPPGFMPKRNEFSLSILGASSLGICIQKILDEGFPAILITVFDYERLPAHSFDLIRSDGCRDHLDSRGREYLSEVDRLLRPGGYYFWSPVGSDVEEWTGELYSIKKLNWISVARFEDFSVWKKEEDGNSHMEGQVNGLVGLQASRIIMPTETSLQGGSKLQPSQNKAEAGATSTSRIDPKSQSLYTPSIDIWRSRVASYVGLLGESRFRLVRNVLDMNAELGSFAAAVMHHQPVWVMNVVPTSDPEMLESIYDRGLLGVQHDWSEAFPTPPRSYDLVHSSRIFSNSEGEKTLDVILEVDRILRPGGLVIVRDDMNAASKVKLLSGSVRWRVLFEYPGDMEQTEYVLIMRKEFVVRHTISLNRRCTPESWNYLTLSSQNKLHQFAFSLRLILDMTDDMTIALSARLPVIFDCIEESWLPWPVAIATASFSTASAATILQKIHFAVFASTLEDYLDLQERRRSFKQAWHQERKEANSLHTLLHNTRESHDRFTMSLRVTLSLKRLQRSHRLVPIALNCRRATRGVAVCDQLFLTSMAEMSSPKQHPVLVDEVDQQRKGDEYERRAANEVSGWAMFCGDYEKAIQFLEKACSLYKPLKAFDKLAGVHMKIARCYLKMGKVEGGASTYVAAAKYYKKIPSQGGAITCLSRAAMLFKEIGQLSTSARYYQEVGDIFEAECKISESIWQYRKAAEIYSANESQGLSNQCRTKVAKYAAELERYTEAIPIFEALAKDAVITGASKKTVKEMFLYAGLCYLCSFGGDGAVVKQALKGFQEVEPNFTSSRESKIILYLATAFEKKNLNLYTEVLNTHEVLFRNDPLARLLANRGQKKLKAMPARVKTTREDSDVRQAKLDGLQLEEPIRVTNEELTQ